LTRSQLIEKAKATKTSDDMWPVHARLVLNPVKHGELKILAQDPLVRRLIRAGHDLVAKNALTKHAWPETHLRSKYRLEVLMEVTPSHLSEFSDVGVVIKRIKRDEEFSHQLGEAASRNAQIRGQIITCLCRCSPVSPSFVRQSRSMPELLQPSLCLAPAHGALSASLHC